MSWLRGLGARVAMGFQARLLHNKTQPMMSSLASAVRAREVQGTASRLVAGLPRGGTAAGLRPQLPANWSVFRSLPVACRVAAGVPWTVIEPVNATRTFTTTAVLRAKAKPYKMRVHSGCKKRFKITALGKVRFYPPGKQHKNTGTAGRKGQKQRQPRYLAKGDEKRIKMAMLCARNLKPAWPKRIKLRLRSESAGIPVEAGTSASGSVKA